MSSSRVAEHLLLIPGEFFQLLTLRQASEAYLTSQSRLLSPASIKLYKSSLDYLLNHFDNDIELEQIAKHDLILWRDSLFDLKKYVNHPNVPSKGEPLGIVTIRRIMGNIKTFFNWLVTVGLLESSPMAAIGKPRAPDPGPRAISVEDFDLLLAAAGQYRGNKWNYEAAYTTRNTAILLFLGSTGCRVGGLCSARLALLQFTDDGANIDVKEKGRGGGTVRTVYLSETAAIATLEWLDHRPHCDHDHLFTGVEGKSAGKPLTTTAVRQMLGRLAKRAGVTSRFNPHAFRHACAREWLRSGADLQTVSQLLGHSDIRVTAKFYARWTDSELQDRHKDFDWTERK